MATFFGEVILPSSRAFFDDKDDSDYESEDCEASNSSEALQVNVKDDTSSERVYNIIIVSDGPIAKDFVDNYIKGERKVIADFLVKPNQELHDETEMIYSKKLSNKPYLGAKLWEVDSKVLFLETFPSLQIKNANQLVSHVGPWLEKGNEIVILASRPLCDYKCDKYDNMPQTFVKSLATSAHSLPSSMPIMEQPNFISGVAASVMSWCEVKRIRCLLHVCYTDALFSDSAILTPLLNSVINTSLGTYIQTKLPAQLKHNNPIHLNIMYQ